MKALNYDVSERTPEQSKLNGRVTITELQQLCYPSQNLQPANRAVLGGILSHVGFVIQDVADGGFMVIRADWGMSHYCHDIAELQAFARKVGVLNHG
jgi:hypothetical protein